MLLKRLELHGFKSFAKKAVFDFTNPITSVVGPNGSGKSNVVEALRFVLGEQSSKSLRSKSGADLVFIGSKALPRGQFARVSATFDNTARQMKITDDNGHQVAVDTDEVTISREVNPDGTNRYSINGNDVRLRDIHELIACLNIGSSGHHIISQGEADRLLFSKPAERREMLEEALGLRMYHYRLKDAERKLRKTEQHEAEAEAARRELLPELRSLKSHVERMERAHLVREELKSFASRYRSMMGQYLSRQDKELSGLESQVETELSLLPPVPTDDGNSLHSQAVAEASRAVASARSAAGDRSQELDAITRQLARLDGTIEALETHVPKVNVKSIPMPAFQDFHTNLREDLSRLSDPVPKADVLSALDSSFDAFSSEYRDATATPDTSRLDEARAQKAELEAQKETAILLHAEAARILETAQHAFQELEITARAEERERFQSQAVRIQLENRQQQLRHQRNDLRAAYDLFVEDLREVETLTGPVSQQDIPLAEVPDQATLRTERQQLERLKLRLEELGGGGGSDILDAYNDVQARVEHLVKELEDIKTARVQLEGMIVEIQEELHQGFQKGLAHVQKSFREHFQRMFGGGDATLSLAPIKKRASAEEGEEEPEEESETAYGIDIAVNLPRKRVSDLSLLSGGERSLTSIALLFALTSVNPPPFLVLDETDAALDEANSRLYGNLLEHLAERTQLIVVTHNRETMARAGVLYGVTLGADDASTLLRVRFEEATQYAK